MQQGDHASLYIDSAVMDRVTTFKFLGVHITDNLTWTLHSNKLARSACWRLHFLRRLKKLGLPCNSLTNFYHCIIVIIQSGCITVWFANCTATNRKALQNMVKTAERLCLYLFEVSFFI